VIFYRPNNRAGTIFFTSGEGGKAKILHIIYKRNSDVNSVPLFCTFEKTTPKQSANYEIYPAFDMQYVNICHGRYFFILYLLPLHPPPFPLLSTPYSLSPDPANLQPYAPADIISKRHKINNVAYQIPDGKLL
jgi:hypothetical protein